MTTQSHDFVAVNRGRILAEHDDPADSPDARSVPHYLQSIGLSLADIAESLRIRA